MTYYVDPIEPADAAFLAGSIAEPSATETEWASGTFALGDERIRSSLHRVFKCAAAGNYTTPPEENPTTWTDMRATDRHLPFGPHVRADGARVYQSRGLERTDADIPYRILARYCSAVALFGLRGATWRVRVRPTAGGEIVEERTGSIKQPATGYWDYGHGQRRISDRVLITGLPIYPAAQIDIDIMAGTGALRRVSQICIGRLRQLHGVDWGGTEYGVTRDPRAWTYRKDETNGDTTVRILGTSYNLSGTVIFSGQNEDNALKQLRDMLGKGLAITPTLAPGYEQSLVFGILTRAPTSRESHNLSKSRIEVEGLPTS